MTTNPKGSLEVDRLLSARQVPRQPSANGDEVAPSIGDRADPDSLTPHERLRELAAIMANGIHRLRAIPPAVPMLQPSMSQSTQQPAGAHLSMAASTAGGPLGLVMQEQPWRQQLLQPPLLAAVVL